MHYARLLVDFIWDVGTSWIWLLLVILGLVDIVERFALKRPVTFGIRRTVRTCGVLLLVAVFLAYADIAEENARLRDSIAARTGQEVVGPLPHYSLGGSFTSYMGFERERDWWPAAQYQDARLDWSELEGITVTAEVRIKTVQFGDYSGWGRVRVKELLGGEVVATGEPVESEEFQLQVLPIPRATGRAVYRLEVLGENQKSLVAVLGELILARDRIATP